MCSAPGCDRALSSKGYCKMHAERVRRHGHPGLAEPKPLKPIGDRLWPRVDRSGGPDACWPWLGPVSSQGYGRVRTGGQGSPMAGAHRMAFILANPDAAEPEAVDHRCHDPKICAGGTDCPHRRCCNPAHLVAATLAENSAVDRQWTKAQLTHCMQGHEFTDANTYRWTDSDGYPRRRCRICAAAAAGRRARARRAS